MYVFEKEKLPDSTKSIVATQRNSSKRTKPLLRTR
jgi:hypothetical protein